MSPLTLRGSLEGLCQACQKCDDLNVPSDYKQTIVTLLIKDICLTLCVIIATLNTLLHLNSRNWEENYEKSGILKFIDTLNGNDTAQ